MNRKILGALVAVAVTSSAYAQSSKQPLVLKPASSWHVDYADDRCRLARQFGEADEQIYVFFDRYGPSDYFRLTVAGKQVKTFFRQG